MECATCPRCGYDLDRLERFTLGMLEIIADGAEVRWQGRRVFLPGNQTLIVSALARSGGTMMKADVLAEVIGYEGENPSANIAVNLCRIRKAFRAIDPSFDAIETRHGTGNGGARWRS